MNDIEDQRVLEGIRTGNRAVIKEFYKENFKYIRKYIIQNSGNQEDVEDVFQDAMMILYEKIEFEPLELKASLRTYFFGICKNLWKKRLRRMKKIIISDEVFTSEEIQEDITTILDTNDREYLYRKYFIQLSDTCQQLLSLVFKNKTTLEIASSMGYSEGYTRKKKFECKKNLIERVEKDPMYDELKIDHSKE
ncbi:sigma-70 family RNA polymerase sigma factor [Aquimarina sp. MMG016]|uniref:RNA polymerase sigma factor n=1 Tax=Aquimarina sp. MMG016 TaxID=2822690 RepID=UPI001B39E8DC|nr:sigma-70 family RNA polymerase sigma factor [Aquimarina sp. MMG016]MBQ4819726.1 sigma-70 family RNA polymerase sigma factor [Aquimarina sp. MMG016]